MTRKTNHRALLGLALCLPLLAGCGDLFTKDLNNPVDPEAEDYQGYRTETDVNAVEAYVDDGSAVYFQAFTISAVEGADGYRLQIATDAEMANLIYGEVDGTFTDNVMRPVVNLSTGVTYYWRGSAQKDGTWGEWTEARSFTVQGLTGLLPADGATTADTTPSLSWTEVEGAVGYEVQVVAEGTEFPDEAGEATDTATYTPTTPLANNATHEWRVRAKDAAGVYGGWSVAQALTVAFGAISGLTPADGATTAETTPSLSWAEVEGAVGYEVRTGSTATDAQAANPVIVSGVTSYDYPTELADNAELHWQVRAKDAAGVYGEWSGVVMVTYVNSFLAADPHFTFQPVIASGSTGTFSMGSTTGDGDEQPVHTVTLTRPYSIGTHEVTNDQYAAVMNEALDRGWITASTTTVQNASGNAQELLDVDDSDCRIDYNGSDLVVNSGYGDHPVTEVTWYGSVAFAYYLNAIEGREQTYDLSDWSVDYTKAGYRLPSEAEWEYAARGGAASNGYTYAGSDTVGDVAWYSSNSGSSTHTVGTKAANELGTYDMSGNVWEWANDWYDSGYYGSSPSSDPSGPSSAAYRVLRGGSWHGGDGLTRVANRSRSDPDSSDGSGGFRLVVSGAP